MTYFRILAFFYISVLIIATDFGAHTAYREYYQRVENEVTGVEN